MSYKMGRPKTKAVATRKRGKATYKLYANGELWTCGRHGFRCGYVSDPENIDGAIDSHEEETAWLMKEVQS